LRVSGSLPFCCFSAPVASRLSFLHRIPCSCIWRAIRFFCPGDFFFLSLSFRPFRWDGSQGIGRFQRSLALHFKPSPSLLGFFTPAGRFGRTSEVFHPHSPLYSSSFSFQRTLSVSKQHYDNRSHSGRRDSLPRGRVSTHPRVLSPYPVLFCPCGTHRAF